MSKVVKVELLTDLWTTDGFQAKGSVVPAESLDCAEEHIRLGNAKAVESVKEEKKPEPKEQETKKDKKHAKK